MAVGTGYSKVTSNGLIFAYDTSDTRNSFKGEPTTNICTGEAYSIYNSGATNYRNNTEVAPPVSGYEVVKVVADTQGSYGQSILWRAPYATSPVMTITNSVYAYLTAGSYVQVGQHWFPWNYGGAQYIPKNQWVRISETYAINDGGSYGTAAMVYSTDGVAYFSMPQYEMKSHVTPFVAFNGTRDSSQALYDLSNNTALSVPEVSYDSVGKMTFDGTNDYINVTKNLGTLSQYTIEHVSYKGSNDRMPIASVSGPLFYQYGDNSWYYTHGGSAAEYYYPKSFTINGWGMWTIVYDGSYVKIYRNGIYEGQQSSSGTANWTNGIRIGNYPGASYPWNGEIAVVKMYNRALSAGEIRDNYSHYKTRFNLQ
jgi:hypothetical protein